MPNRKTSPLRIYAVFAILYVLGAIYAMSYFFQNSALGDAYPVGRTSFEAMTNGTAYKPFVYRQLVPILVNAIDAATPRKASIAIANRMEDFKYNGDYQDVRFYMPWLYRTFPGKDSHYRRLVASVIIFGFLLGYMAAVFALACEMFPETPAAALFAPLFAVMAFCSFGFQWQYVYDLPCLCLSTACFYFIYRGRTRLYLLAFLLSCINKETAIFSMVFFSIWYWHRMDDRQFALLWALQCAIYLIVKSSLSISFTNNPGLFLEHNTQLVLTGDLLSVASIDRVAVFGVLWLLFTWRWQEKPEFLKMTLWLLPMFYVAYVLFGFPYEYRVFFDLHGPLVLLATHTLVVATGIGESSAFASLKSQRSGHALTA